MSSDQPSFELLRFVAAQAPVYDQVCAELRAGRKRTHWMWFVFPQIQGLGSSPTARTYAIQSLAEARAYLNHPVLGTRLQECVGLVNAVEGRSAEAIFATPDTQKFRSSLTLFLKAADDPAVFQQALDKYFEGRLDEATLERL